ncbi:hypothetical protein glysoja_039907 [Glycine soja]|uniref:Uncharacterized protein n=1 Tax=Glycine soja TaxID=3848 RepID=A0A0B2SMX2_GLYSO|nr:hypothetical protein glysoja_039907 [Glycine soja]
MVPFFPFFPPCKKKEKCTCAAVLLILQLSLVTLGGKESEGVSLSPFMDIMKDWVAELTDSFIQ